MGKQYEVTANLLRFGNDEDNENKSIFIISRRNSQLGLISDTENQSGEPYNSTLAYTQDNGANKAILGMDNTTNNFHFYLDSVETSNYFSFRYGSVIAYNGLSSPVTITNKGSSAFDINADNGQVTFGVGAYFPTTGGTPSELNYYEEGTLTIDWEGPWATNQTNKTINFVRIGNEVILEIEAVVANAGAGSVANIFLTSGDELPARLRPTGFTQELPIWTVDNGVYKQGTLAIDLTGNIVIFPGALSSTNFSGSGDTGFGTSGAAITVKYKV